MNFKKLIFHIILIITCSSIFTTLIVQIKNPLFSNIGSKDAWINFFGSITGGFLTLYGVWWTIKDQEKQRDIQISIDNKPLIKFNAFVENTIIEGNNSKVKIMLQIENKGKGDAKDILTRVEPVNVVNRLAIISQREQLYVCPYLCQYESNMYQIEIIVNTSDIQHKTFRIDFFSEYTGYKTRYISKYSCDFIKENEYFSFLYGTFTSEEIQ